jgi:hypothetical protein
LKGIDENREKGRRIRSDGVGKTKVERSVEEDQSKKATERGKEQPRGVNSRVHGG